jgi:hypothetical protein
VTDGWSVRVLDPITGATLRDIPFVPDIADPWRMDGYYFRTLALDAAGRVMLSYVNGESRAAYALVLDEASSQFVWDDERMMLTGDAIEAATSTPAGYFTYASYGPDRSLAALVDDPKRQIVVMDVASRSVEKRLDYPRDLDVSYVQFSADGQHLYLIAFVDPDNELDDRVRFMIIDMADNTVRMDTELPASVLWVSPDEHYAVLDTLEYVMVVVDLQTGVFSDPIDYLLSEAAVANCDTPDTGMIVMDVLWLPDSSGFITLESPIENTDIACDAVSTKMRHFTVGG